MAAETMTEGKKTEKPFFLDRTVTLYAPNKTTKGAYHQPGDVAKVHPNQKKKFLDKGYTETPVVAAEPKA